MNDFTKEELKTLLCGLGHINEIVPDGDIELIKKIHLLIDNYPKCDHCFGWGFYNENEEVSYETGVWYRCRHCDIFFRFLFENSICIGIEELE